MFYHIAKVKKLWRQNLKTNVLILKKRRKGAFKIWGTLI